jgi:fermentation-respiration switch protein FrsA (DUF1100 family)
MRWVLGLLIGAALVYGAVLALVYVRQRSLQYAPFGPTVTAAQAALAGFEDVVLETPDGERIAGWYKAPQPGRTIVLYFHGNGGSLSLRHHRARLLTETGNGLLMVTYRGYPGSTGEPSEPGLRADARAAYDHLARRFPPTRIVIYGESLGSGVAVRLATERGVAGLILDAPFTSAADVAKRVYPFLPVDLLMKDPFRSIDLAGAVKAPVLVLHGELDPVVPIGFGERLFAALPEPKRFVRLPGGHETNLTGPGLQAVRDFLSDVDARVPPPPPDPAPVTVPAEGYRP